MDKILPLRPIRPGPTPEDAAARAQEEVDRVFGWANKNAVTFDPTKAEAVYFLDKRSRHTTLPEIRMGNHTIQASEEIRWLGTFLDKSLNFRRHAAEWASKGVRLAQYLRCIASCTIGPGPGPMTTFVRTVILPTVLHGAEVWWPGRTRATNTGETRNSCGKQLAAIDNAIMAGIRATIPTWRTMPTVALRRETGIPPAHVLLEEKRLANSARIRRLDINLPLRLRTRESAEDARRRFGLRTSNRGRRTTDHIHGSHNQRTYWSLPESEDPPLSNGQDPALQVYHTWIK
ncbi:hypothetical protein K3495_g10111 [Podosphaera aphanis]|nr:hypothetical protein K3495_g10111 [Podosphaera aphanis]